jgi:hypothetical protein
MAGDDRGRCYRGENLPARQGGFEKFPARFSAGAPSDPSIRPLETTVVLRPIRRLLLGVMADGTVRPQSTA